MGVTDGVRVTDSVTAALSLENALADSVASSDTVLVAALEPLALAVADKDAVALGLAAFVADAAADQETTALAVTVAVKRCVRVAAPLVAGESLSAGLALPVGVSVCVDERVALPDTDREITAVRVVATLRVSDVVTLFDADRAGERDELTEITLAREGEGEAEAVSIDEDVGEMASDGDGDGVGAREREPLVDSEGVRVPFEDGDVVADAMAPEAEKRALRVAAAPVALSHALTLAVTLDVREIAGDTLVEGLAEEDRVRPPLADTLTEFLGDCVGEGERDFVWVVKGELVDIVVPLEMGDELSTGENDGVSVELPLGVSALVAAVDAVAPPVCVAATLMDAVPVRDAREERDI